MIATGYSPPCPRTEQPIGELHEPQGGGLAPTRARAHRDRSRRVTGADPGAALSGNQDSGAPSTRSHSAPASARELPYVHSRVGESRRPNVDSSRLRSSRPISESRPSALSG